MSAGDLYNQMKAMSQRYPAMMVDPRPHISLERVANILDDVVAELQLLKSKVYALETENEMMKEAIEELDT